MTIPHNKPSLSSDELDACDRVLKSGWLAPHKEVRDFENSICAWLGLPEGSAVAVSNGTSALFLALRTLGAKAKSVAIPVYCCSAVANAAAMAGAQIEFVDNAKSSVNIDTAAPLSNIIVVPHMYGLPCDLGGVKKGLKVVEDCAQALGAKNERTYVGLGGEMGIFSFYATKLITSGGHGGMVVSANPDHIADIRDYIEFDCRYDQNRRFNLQMTEIQAAIGNVQLTKLPEFLMHREEIFKIYRQAGIPLIETDENNKTPNQPVRYRAIFRHEKPEVLIRELKKHDITVINPLEFKALLDFDKDYPNAAALSRTTVSLPIYPTLDLEDARRIANIVRGLL